MKTYMGTIQITKANRLGLSPVGLYIDTVLTYLLDLGLRWVLT